MFKKGQQIISSECAIKNKKILLILIVRDIYKKKV